MWQGIRFLVAAVCLSITGQQGSRSTCSPQQPQRRKGWDQDGHLDITLQYQLLEHWGAAEEAAAAAAAAAEALEMEKQVRYAVGSTVIMHEEEGKSHAQVQVTSDCFQRPRHRSGQALGTSFFWG